MPVGAAGMARVGGSTVSIRALVPISYLSGAAHSSDLSFSCTSQSRIVLVPSCLSYPNSSLSYRRNVRNLRNLRASLLPSILYSSSPSWSQSSFIGSATIRAAGLNGKLLVQEGRRSASRGVIVRCMSEQSESVLEDMICSKNSQNAVVVYSKSWCPYCGRVKSLFRELGVEFLLIELDNLVEEQEVQEALRRLTRQSTVPNIFIGGKHIGGCDDTMELHKSGKLMPLLTAAGAKISKT
ncbi:hypothetical protein Mapa_010733 [Marchantia paleacea]|nr:hypothetical protein Mapa_010733 [Marchantia paleacea]